MITSASFYMAAIPAVALVGLSKGGFSGVGLLALPLLALVVSPVQAAAIMLPILLAQDAVSVYAYRASFDRLNLIRLVPGACIGIALGYLLAAYVSDAAVSLALGVISISFAVRQWWRSRGGAVPPQSQPGVVSGWFWGGVSGFTSMIAHAGGPPFQVYTLPQRMAPLVYAGTTSMFFATLNVIKVAPYFWLGQFTTENLATAAVLCPLAIVSTWAGVQLVRRVSADRFYIAIYALLFLVGAKLMWDGVTGIFSA
ncbi:MAG: sulfite exporter TauE/SafE family protein [Rhodospirillaceae bacterium]|nr:sulfite exporter TauE/SafE family protein [Rhodospirillaceae bacterium]